MIRGDNTKRALENELSNFVRRFKDKYGNQQVNCEIDKAYTVFEKSLFPYMNNTCATDTCSSNSCPPNTCSPNSCLTNSCPAPVSCPRVDNCDDDSLDRVMRNVSTNDINFQSGSFSFGDWNNLINKVMRRIERDNARSDLPLVIYPESNKLGDNSLADRLENCFGIKK